MEASNFYMNLDIEKNKTIYHVVFILTKNGIAIIDHKLPEDVKKFAVEQVKEIINSMNFS